MRLKLIDIPYPALLQYAPGATAGYTQQIGIGGACA